MLSIIALANTNANSNKKLRRAKGGRIVKGSFIKILCTDDCLVLIAYSL